MNRFFKVKYYLFALSLFVALLLTFHFPVHAQSSGSEAQEETVEASVTRILEEKQIVPAGGDTEQSYQKLELIITTGRLTGKTITVESGNYPMANIPKYVVNDHVVLTRTNDLSGGDIYYITDYVRRDALLLLFVLFIGAAVVIGRWRGFMSLL